MTITQTIPKKAEVTHPDRQTPEEIAEVWRRIHITTWEFEGNIRPTNWTEVSWVRVPVGGRDVVGKATPGRRGSGWAAMENEKDTTLTAITSGSKYFSYVRSPAPSHTQTLSKPFRTLAIKWEVNIFLRSLLASVIPACIVYHCVGMYPAYICIFLHEHVYENATVQPYYSINTAGKKIQFYSIREIRFPYGNQFINSSLCNYLSTFQ